MNILIVDDDKLVTTSLKMILETDSSISVLATGNDGKEAITLYEEVKPDVLIMDIRMEHMTGIEAAKKILEKDANARILFLTTFLDDEYIIEALHLGAKGYILKQEYENIIPAFYDIHVIVELCRYHRNRFS